MSLKIYGIANCDTVRKAVGFFRDNEIEFEFVDFKKNPPKLNQLQEWEKQLGEDLVNKRGPTFRKIKDNFESATPNNRLKLLIENTSAIKRPIVQQDDKVRSIGFSEEEFKSLYLG